jgi:hypothetical protein
MDNLFEHYNQVKKTKDLFQKVAVLNQIIEKYPKLIDYLFNKVDSCFGTHKVYLIHMNVNGQDMIKLGYTKQNDVSVRFSEKRYAGRDEIKIVEILREGELQAKGAIEFEKFLKETFSSFKKTTSLTLPGKGEFYEMIHKDFMVNKYDENFTQFESIVGLKSPN